MSSQDGFFRSQREKGRAVHLIVIAGLTLVALLGIGYLVAALTL